MSDVEEMERLHWMRGFLFGVVAGAGALALAILLVTQ
jgi:hypothetical protein